MKSICHHARVALEIGQSGHALRRLHIAPSLTALGFDQTGCCPLSQRCWYKTTTIHGCARPGNKTVACSNLAAVCMQNARDALTQPLSGLLRRVKLDHQNDSSTAWVTT